MQVKQLEYLLKVVECGSITKAAEQLYISQPSLTKAIQSLEDEYGRQLLIRKSRGVELTVEGKNFVHYARRVLTAANALDQNFIRTQSGERSRLFLASQQLDFVYDLMLQIYQENEGKKIHYNLVETDRNEVIRLVLDGEVDLGLLVRNVDDAKMLLWNKEVKRLDIHVIDSAGVYAMVGPKSAYYERAEISFEEAERCPHLMLDMEAQAKGHLYFDNVNSRYNTKKIVFFNTANACEHFLKETDALAFTSKWTRGCFKDPSIRELRITSRKEQLENCNELLWVKRAGEPLNDTEKQFLQLLYQHLGKDEEDYPEFL